MAATESSDALKFLGKKIGPLPAWVWLAAFAAIWYYFSRKNTTTTTAAGTGTDPAGNTGYIDPVTGYVYGSPEDVAALQAQGTAAGTGGTAGTGAQPGQYSTDEQWATAALNYLVAAGISPTEANQAIELYLNSQPMSAKQSADVNVAIEAIGSPPQLPGPSAGGTGSGGTGSGGTSAPKNPSTPAKLAPPKNLHVTGRHPRTAQVSWDMPGGVHGASWVVQNHKGGSSGPVVDNFTTSNTVANLGGALARPPGLKPGARYTVRVRENKAGAPWGTLSYTTAK